MTGVDGEQLTYKSTIFGWYLRTSFENVTLLLNLRFLSAEHF